jgi:hypothetical protein
MPYRISLFNSFVATTSTCAAAVLLSVRTRYRAFAEARLGDRVSLWGRETWDNPTAFAIIVVATACIQIALVLFALRL